MGRKKAASTVLTNLELEVMKVVWDANDALTVRDVVDRLNAERDPVLAYNTVQTMLNILRDKGFVESERGSGRAHVYRSRRSQGEVSRSMVGDLVERLFDGDVQPLLVNLVDQEQIGRPELEQLQLLIERRLEDRPDAAGDHR